MPASKIRSDYEGLRAIAGVFSQQAEQCGAMLSSISGGMSSLRGGNWIGKGADKFYAEMDSAVIPSLRRLVGALNQAARITTQISRIMRQAEADSARVLGGGSGTGLDAGGGLTGMGAQLGAAVGAAILSAGAAGAGQAAASAIGAQVGAAIGGAIAGQAGAEAGESLGAAMGSAIAADVSTAATAAGTASGAAASEIGAAIGAAVREALGQGAAASAIGAAVSSALTSVGMLVGPEQAAMTGMAQAAEGALMPAIATLTGVVGAVSGKVALSDLSSINFSEVSMTPSSGGPVPIPYPKLQMGHGIGQGLGDLLNVGNVGGFGSSMMQALGFDGPATASFVKETIGVFLQMTPASPARSYQMLSNIMKTCHDMQMTIIRNMR